MNDEDRDSGLAVSVAVAIALLTTLLAIGIAIGTALTPSTGKRASAAQAGEIRIVRLYFEVASSELPLDALTQLAPLVVAHGGAFFVISGFHDASGDAAANAELAKRRAVAVSALLTQSGVKSERIELRKPAVTTGGVDPKEARRVEVTVR